MDPAARTEVGVRAPSCACSVFGGFWLEVIVAAKFEQLPSGVSPTVNFASGSGIFSGLGQVQVNSLVLKFEELRFET